LNEIKKIEALSLDDKTAPTSSKTNSPVKPTSSLTSSDKINPESSTLKPVIIEENRDKQQVSNQTRHLNSSATQMLGSKSEASFSKISFYYGNPTVDIVKGFIHIYKDRCLLGIIW
jgi:hypothetical protein